MDFSVILTCDSSYGISIKTQNNKTSIGWNIPANDIFFENLTNTNENNVIIMGHETADMIKNPFSNRINIVITSQDSYYQNEKFKSYKNINLALDYLKTQSNIREVFVISDSTLNDEIIQNKRCRNIYLNMIMDNYNCDVKLSEKIIKQLQSQNYSLNTKTITDICYIKNVMQQINLLHYTYTNWEELQYLSLLNKILSIGDYRETRNAKTYSIFGEKLEFDMDNGFPLLTTKKMFCRGILEELLFFLRGDTNSKLLEDKNVMIWHDNTTEEFLKKNNKNLEEYDMGPMYGFQWRFFNAPYHGCHHDYTNHGVDQLKIVVDTLNKDPYSRRILMTTYNPAQAEDGVLYPCHGLQIQFYVEKNRISLQMYQR